jgi:thioredoxin-like negative regulator of GroEL
MIRAKNSYRLVWIGFSAATIFSCPVHAQAVAETPEVLADAALQIDTGIALARRQITDTDLLGATGTLERVLLAHPQATEARLLYASLLCRLDDSEGAGVELRLLAPEAITDEAWREVTEACGPLPRPGQPLQTTPEGGLQP